MNPYILPVIIGVTSALAALTLLISYYAYRLSFRRGKDCEPFAGLDGDNPPENAPVRRALIEELLSKEYSEVSITAKDGTRLFGAYYHVNDGAPLEIMFHGYRSTPFRDFSGGATAAMERGHNVLLVYQRSHLKSEGRSITFGALERLDAVEWAKYATDTLGAKQIMLLGISMGAATVLLSSALDLPDTVKCIVADCPYSSATEIIRRVARGMGYPDLLMLPFLHLGARIFGGFRLSDADVKAAVKDSRLPILLIHGDQDGFVPHSMSVEIHGENKEMIHFVSFPGADHGLSFISDRDRYLYEVEKFSSQYIK